jgi:hypothetical protein
MKKGDTYKPEKLEASISIIIDPTTGLVVRAS